MTSANFEAKMVTGKVVQEDSNQTKKEFEDMLTQQINVDEESDLEDSGDFMEKLQEIADKKGEGDNEEVNALKEELKNMLETKRLRDWSSMPSQSRVSQKWKTRPLKLKKKWSRIGLRRKLKTKWRLPWGKRKKKRKWKRRRKTMEQTKTPKPHAKRYLAMSLRET